MYLSLIPTLLVASLCSHALAAPYVHDINKGLSYQGFVASAGIESFHGIPYGKDTSGARRFAPPEAFEPPTNYTYNATAFGASCPQPLDGGTYADLVTYQSEDCLNLNIVRPARNGTLREKLPVMVYIYGGSLFQGTASDKSTQADGLVRESVSNGLPVIGVELNYRLNIFGFATSEALRGHKSLNAGLRDQRLALEWVQENIASFGGDPEKITIFGQSSGGLAVAMQVLAYGGSKPVPFASAIMESTALEPTMTTNISFNSTTGVAALAGCNMTDSQSASVIDCLRALPMSLLLNYTITQQTASSADNDGDIYLPTVDQDFLPIKASQLIAQGKFPKMPLIVGWQEDDATLFTSTSIKTAADTRAFFETYYYFLPNSTMTELLALYPVSDFSANPSANLSAEFYRSAQIFRDILLTCNGFSFEIAMAQKYLNETSDPPVFLYTGNQTLYTPYLDANSQPGLGITHTSEFPYVFADVEAFNVTSLGLKGYVFKATPGDYALVKRWSRSWSTFAYTGRPSMQGKETLQGWTSAFPGGKGDGEVFVIGGGEEGLSKVGADGVNEALVRQKLGERCGFLNRPDVVEQLQY